MILHLCQFHFDVTLVYFIVLFTVFKKILRMIHRIENLRPAKAENRDVRVNCSVIENRISNLDFVIGLNSLSPKRQNYNEGVH